MRIPLSFAVITFILLIAGLLSAQTISISLDKVDYSDGDSIKVMIGASNGTSAATVDLYFALLSPSNDLYFFPNWTEGIGYVANVKLPPNFDLPESELFSYDLPCQSPNIQSSGTYSFAIGLTTPGTLNFISLDSAAFSYTSDQTLYRLSHLYIGLNRYYRSESTDETFWIDAVFNESNKECSTPYPNQVEECACKQTAVSEDTSTGEFYNRGLDAGVKILVTGLPSGDLYLLRKEETAPYVGYYYKEERDLLLSDFVSSTDYTFIGTGGEDVVPFNETVTSLPDFKMTSPILSPDLVIDTTKPLNLEWTNPLGTPYELQVALVNTAYDIENQTIYALQCVCRFVDDGSASIPVNVLGNMVMEELPLGCAAIEFIKVKQNPINLGGLEGNKESYIRESSDCEYQ